MDLFTHILISYFFNILMGNPNESVILFSVLMGTLPDWDVIWAPFLGRKFIYARHHGVAHSVIFVVAGVAISAWVAIAFFHLNAPYHTLLIYGIPTAILHLLCDYLTTWTVPLLFPLSRKEYRYPIDTAVNPYLTATSFSVIAVLYDFRVVHLPYPVFLNFIYLIAGLYFLYFLFRVIIKLWLGWKYMGKSRDFELIPTSNPLTWTMARSSYRCGGALKTICYTTYNLLRNSEPQWQEFNVNLRSVKPPLDSVDKAVWYAFNIEELQKMFGKVRYPVAVAMEDGDFVYKGKRYPYSIFWYALEMKGKKRAHGFNVYIDESGNYKIKRGFRRIDTAINKQDVPKN